MPAAVRNTLWGGAGLVVAFGWVLGYEWVTTWAS
jgi:hypothetical protein